ncbi:MAG TPA: YidC/Oxa1 family membrane protein insertase [Acidimicrobiales bacterium]|nr:YidC/Oxa1 family membrane protein insertase [Acidimicrobiales bacterium]
MLAFFYDLIPSYAIAITLLTLTVMLVLSPLTLKSTRNMLEMQRLQPELKKLQVKYKNDRQKLNEEMMAFYKEHKVNPVAGCVPMLLQMPVFIVMYRVIHGLNSAEPKYLDKSTELYKSIVSHHGRMVSFGLDLGNSASKALKDSFTTALPFIILVGLVIVTQYIQTKQMTARNPAAAAANPQAQMMTRIMPVFFGFISYGIPAGVNIYFLVSALFRIAQQEAMYRWDPHVSRHAATLKESRPIETKSKDVTKSNGQANGSGSKALEKPSARNKKKRSR